VARPMDRNPRSASGDWFVDTRCIDCGSCRHVAPGLLVERAGHSVFDRQPSSADAERVWQAAEVCPTQSIGTISRLRPPERVFPRELAPGIFLCGYNSPDSYGANSWLVQRPGGNLLVDSPRFTRRLREPIAELGGIAAILLTHRDDVADAEQWAAEFGATVTIHRDDRSAAPFASDVVEGLEPVEVRPGVTVVPVPGHTRGSVLYLVDDTWLFTGDSLAWSQESHDLYAFEDACWYSWPEQQRSLARAAAFRFEQIFPGHGSWSPRLPADEQHARLVALTDRM